MADLPDWYSQVVTETMEASSIRGGADAAKPASPVSKDVYFATDTKILYICVADGSWTGFDASILVQGVLTLYENMVGNSKKITGLAAPAASGDAARKDEVDDVESLLYDAAPSSVVGTKSAGTEYTNGSKIRVVEVVAQPTGSAHWFVYGWRGESSADDNIVVDDGDVDYNNDLGCISMIVPAGWKYKITVSNATILSWWETDLH